MIGLPLVFVRDLPANLLGLLPRSAGIVAMRFERSLDFGDALRTGLHLGLRSGVPEVDLRRRSGCEGSREK